MTKKEKIIEYYYEEKLSIIDISKKINVSKQYISKIVRNDNRYIEEKQRRMQKNKQERNKKKVIWNRNKRKQMRNARLDGVIEMLHNQAVCELSRKGTINNRAFKKWNSGMYEFHSKTNEFRIAKEIKNKVSYAVPKKIKWE